MMPPSDAWRCDRRAPGGRSRSPLPLLIKFFTDKVQCLSLYCMGVDYNNRRLSIVTMIGKKMVRRSIR